MRRCGFRRPYSPPRRAWWRPRYPQKNLVWAGASSPKISRGGHGILPVLSAESKAPLSAKPRPAPSAPPSASLLAGAGAGAPRWSAQRCQLPAPRACFLLRSPHTTHNITNKRINFASFYRKAATRRAYTPTDPRYAIANHPPICLDGCLARIVTIIPRLSQCLYNARLSKELSYYGRLSERKGSCETPGKKVRTRRSL